MQFKKIFWKKIIFGGLHTKNWLQAMGAIYHAYYDNIKRFPLSFSLKYALKKLVIVSLWLSFTFVIDCAIVDFKNMTTPIFRVPHFAEIYV